MKSPVYILYHLFVKPALTLYLRSDRQASFGGFQLLVKKGVFHPLLFFSTKVMYEFMLNLYLNRKSFLEIGSGSGLLSMLAHRMGAKVTAVDVDPLAIENTRMNFARNFGKTRDVRLLQSDVFSALASEKFDVIVINPPYYFKDPVHPSQQAWYCGKEGVYFENLFSGLTGYTHRESEVFMVLEEGCELQRIAGVAGSHGLSMEKVLEKKIKWEVNFIFRISAVDHNTA